MEQLIAALITKMRAKFREYPNAYYVFDDNGNGKLDIFEFAKGM